MPENVEWIIGQEGCNLKFKRETLLNYGMNRWGLNKASSVGPTSELIRRCAPKTVEDWEAFYFQHAQQKKTHGVGVTEEYLIDLGRKLCVKLSEVVQSELEAISEEECIAYVHNLVINRTYEGYQAEIRTIYGQLERVVGAKVEPAPDEWDRSYNVDFFIRVGSKHIGIQIKPIATGRTLNDYQWERMHAKNHARFSQEFGGRVFFVYSVKAGDAKRIHNAEVIEEIREEIARLSRGPG